MSATSSRWPLNNRQPLDYDADQDAEALCTTMLPGETHAILLQLVSERACQIIELHDCQSSRRNEVEASVRKQKGVDTRSALLRSSQKTQLLRSTRQRE